jgi:hypothetical protein
VLSCRTNEEKLLCLKCLGSTTLENSGLFHTIKLHHTERTKLSVCVKHSKKGARQNAGSKCATAHLDASAPSYPKREEPHLSPTSDQETMLSVASSETKSNLHAELCTTSSCNAFLFAQRSLLHIHR